MRGPWLEVYTVMLALESIVGKTETTARLAKDRHYSHRKCNRLMAAVAV
jgi:hypothetical protein